MLGYRAPQVTAVLLFAPKLVSLFWPSSFAHRVPFTVFIPPPSPDTGPRATAHVRGSGNGRSHARLSLGKLLEAPLEAIYGPD